MRISFQYNIRHIFRSTYGKGVLLYLGMHEGKSFDAIFKDYGVCYGFEANPELFEMLQKKYFKYKNVFLFNGAVATANGFIDFNISNNNGESSSIGNFKKDWPHKEIKMIKKVNVPSINLMEFLRENRIDYIDDYISDIQGLDLAVLSTLKPFLDKKQIGTITCEVTKDSYSNIYEDLPDNSESGFDSLLRYNYECVAKGWGILHDGNFSEVPEDWWEMDCKWKVK